MIAIHYQTGKDFVFTQQAFEAAYSYDKDAPYSLNNTWVLSVPPCAEFGEMRVWLKTIDARFFCAGNHIQMTYGENGESISHGMEIPLDTSFLIQFSDVPTGEFEESIKRLREFCPPFEKIIARLLLGEKLEEQSPPRSKPKVL